MARPKHPNKDIESALQYAEVHNWRVEKSQGSAHSWGQILCPYNISDCRNGIHCRSSIWSTPRSPVNHARLLKRIVDKCIYIGDDND